MKAAAKRGKGKSLKSANTKSEAATNAKTRKGKKGYDYPIAETLRWVADGEKLLEKWGAIKSPGAKRIAGGVAKVLSVLEALSELRKM